MLLCAGLPPAGGGRGGRGSRKQQSSGRSGLLALLRAVEENDHYSSGAGDGMDWAAAAAAGYESDVDRKRSLHKPNAKRQRFSSGDPHSDSYSVDSAGDSRQDAARSDDLEEDEEEASRSRKQLKPGITGRMRREPANTGYLTGDAFDRYAEAATGERAAVKAKVVQKKPARAPSPSGQAQGPKRHRCVAGTNQWVTEDGLTVWPKVGAVGVLPLIAVIV